MKFTKEQAVEKLNQTLTNSGKKPLRMSARTLEAHTENLMTLIGDDEMELDDFVTKVKPMLESVNANVEHDLSESIKEYEKNHPQPKPGVEPPKPKDGDDDPMKKLQEQLATIQKQLQEQTDAKAVEVKKGEIRKYLDDNNVKDTKWIDSILSIATIGKDDDAEEKGKAYLALYNQSRQGGSSVTPGTPSSGGADDNLNKAFDAVRNLRTPESDKK